MNNLAELNAKIRGVLRRLRIPCARSVSLRYDYNVENNINPGITLTFPADELTVIAPGDGKVVVASLAQPTWVYSSDQLHVTQGSYQVVIDHGSGVRTVTHGMSTCEVFVGQQIQRGQNLGQRTDREVFFALIYLDRPYNPVGLNRHFKTQNGSIIRGQGGLFRFAPDFTVRDLADGIVSTLVGGYRYFVPATCAVKDFLLNIDFNGDGTKEGAAATGINVNDFWNVYVPVSFQSTTVGGYGYGCTGDQFEISPVVYLLDYLEAQSPVWFERQYLASNNGSTAWFDPMLSRWAGGYDGLGTPYENTFSLRSVPPGNYVLYLYANEGTPPDTSTFYVSVDAGSPTVKTNTPTITSAFVNNGNYVQYSISVAALSTIHVKAYGYIAGVQLKRS